MIQTYGLTRFDTPGAGTAVESTDQGQTQQTASNGSEATQTSGQSYTVQSGDSFWGIAEKFGISVDQLMADNGWTSATTIMPGETITI